MSSNGYQPGSATEVAKLAYEPTATPQRLELAAAILNGEHFTPPDHVPAGAGNAHRRLDLDILLAQADTEIAWRCDRIAADGYLTILGGQGGEGKSYLSMALGRGVLMGGRVAGIDCRQGSVVIFDAENGPRLLGQRIKAADIPTKDLAVYDADGLDVLTEEAWIAEQMRGAGLVIFDSLRMLAPGAKENDSDDMAPILTAFKRLARTTDAAVILIHHRGKSEDSDYRGSSAIRDQTDLMFVLERAKGDPGADWRRTLRTVKCRIDEEPRPRYVGLKHYRGRFTVTEAEPHRKATVRDEVADQVAALLTAQGPMKRPDIAREIGRDPKDKTLRDAIVDLVDRRKIIPTEHGYEGVHPATTPGYTPDTLDGVGEATPLKGYTPDEQGVVSPHTQAAA